VTDEFNEDLIMHINTVFSTLHQLGIGPNVGFAIEDDSAEWANFLTNDPLINSVKSYMYLRVRLLFDPPSTSFHISSMERQIEQIEWRLNVKREQETWIPPVSSNPVDPEVIIVPSNQAWYSEP
jgi:hypothetical protein